MTLHLDYGSVTSGVGQRFFQYGGAGSQFSRGKAQPDNLQIYVTPFKTISLIAIEYSE
jgi:hypothetical protein